MQAYNKVMWETENVVYPTPESNSLADSTIRQKSGKLNVTVLPLHLYKSYLSSIDVVGGAGYSMSINLT